MAVLAAAAVVGFIFFLPHLLIPALAPGRQYTPLVLMGVGSWVMDETYFYAPRVREITEGKPFSYSPASAEHKESININEVHDRIPLYAVALAALAMGSLAGGFMLCNFLFPALCFLVFYMLARKLANGRAAAMAAAAATVILPRFFTLIAFTGPAGFSRYLTGVAGMQPLFFMRLLSPQIVSFFGFGALLVAWNALENPGHRLKTAIAGVCVGLLAYCYIYYATFVPVVLIFLCAFYLARRDRARAVQCAAMLGIAAAVMFPFVLVYMSMDRATYADLSAYMHLGGPVFPLHACMTLAILPFMFRAFKGRGLPLQMVVAFFLAGLFWDILPRFAPAFPQFKHYEYIIIEPWFFLCLFAGAAAALERGKKFSPAKTGRIFAAAFAVILVMGALRQTQFSLGSRDSFSFEPGLQAVLGWLDSHIPKDDVIIALHSHENALIPVHTRCNVFDPTPFLIYAGRAEMDDRFMIVLALQGVAPANVKAALPEMKDPLGPYGRYMFLDSNARNEEIERVTRKYEQSGAGVLKEKLLRKYRADYLLLTPLDTQVESSANRVLSLQKIYSSGGYVVYKIMGVK